MAFVGIECSLFRGTAGVTGSTAMSNVREVTVNISNGDADITTRGASGWRVSKVTLSEATLTFSMVYDPDDADFTAVRTAFFAKTAIAFFVADGAGTTSTACSGVDADWVISSFELGQPLEDAVMVNVECKPTKIAGSSGRNPTWKTATA